MPTAPNHETRVALQRAWNEHRPECSCGWVGSYWPRESQAEQEADLHRHVPTVAHDREVARG